MPKFMEKFPTAMLVFLAIAGLVLGLDLWTKAYAVATLKVEGTSYPIIDGFFSFTLRYNHGAAFSFLHDAGGWQRWFFAIIAGVMSVVLVIWLARVALQKPIEALGIALVLGGALGNLYDRVTLGYVVDFIHVYYQQYHFPAFNIADSGITCGAALLIWDAVFASRKAKHEAKIQS
jgi:signal peptidase II